MAKKTILVCGYGPGISAAIAEKFGREGFAVALVARNADRLGAGVKALRDKGVEAEAFPTDLGDPSAVRALVGKARAALGRIAIVQWNAYGAGGGDLLAADTAALRGLFDVSVVGLLAAVQEALPDMRGQDDAAVLVTNGGLGLYDPKVDAMAVQWGAMGLAVANAAKHKVVGLLAEKLKSERIYVGEVLVMGTVKGTAFDAGNATIAPATVAEKFWALYRAKADVSASVA